jgi:polyhydroxyalkanoate synthesis repressor PhaR
MPLIKRYPNRKLYDTEAKRYITLDDIAGLIRQGQEVRVVDYTTSEDLTALTLTQIIFEQEKKQSGFLPQAVLTGLVRAGGQTLGAVQRTLETSVSVLRQIDREIERRVQALINQGELDEKEGSQLIDKLLAQAPRLIDPEALSAQELEQALRKRELPSRRDLQNLAEQLDALTIQLDSISLKD